MANIIFPNRWTLKPSPGTQIDWGHPLANALSFGVILNEGGGVPRELVTNNPFTLVSGNIGWGGASYGGGIGPGPISTSCQVQTTIDPIGGLATYTTFSAFNLVDHIASHEALGISRWGGAQTNFILRRDSDTTTRAIAAFSGGNIDSGTGLTDNHVLGYNSAVVRLTNAVLDLYVNAVSLMAPVIGSGTQNTSTAMNVFSDDAVSDEGIGSKGGLGYCVYVWKRSLSLNEIQWLHVEPYAMFTPQSPRRTYFVPAVTTSGDIITVGNQLQVVVQ